MNLEDNDGNWGGVRMRERERRRVRQTDRQTDRPIKGIFDG